MSAAAPQTLNCGFQQESYSTKSVAAERVLFATNLFTWMYGRAQAVAEHSKLREALADAKVPLKLLKLTRMVKDSRCDRPERSLLYPQGFPRDVWLPCSCQYSVFEPRRHNCRRSEAAIPAKLGIVANHSVITAGKDTCDCNARRRCTRALERATTDFAGYIWLKACPVRGSERRGLSKSRRD